MPTSDALSEAIEAATANLEAAEDSAPVEETPEPQDEVPGEAPDGDEHPEQDETPDDVEDDEDDPDAEESADEEDPEDEDDDEEGDDEDGDTLAIDDSTVVKLPDGTEINGAELQKSILRQADYTRKTQELAAQRQEVQDVIDKMETWYQERVEDPAGWISEIASDTPEPHKVIADAVAATGNANTALAGIIRSLIEGGNLADEFVERLGLQQIAEQAKASAGEDRVARLEQELQEEREQREAAARQQEILAEYDSQWASIVETEALEFGSDAEAQEAQIELMRFALDNEIADLEKAWAAMSYLQQKQAPQPKSEPAKKRAKATVEKKRKAAAANRKPTGGKAPAPVAKGDLNAAALAAWDKVVGG